jgi:hypothetical protein
MWIIVSIVPVNGQTVWTCDSARSARIMRMQLHFIARVSASRPIYCAGVVQS